MAITERSRSVLFQGFTSIIDDEQAVQEMMACFPARDVEEPATKEYVRAETAALRTEMAAMEVRMTRDITGQIRDDIHRMAWINLGGLTAFAAVLLAAIRL